MQKVREAAARAQCQNNLKQMGLAFHAHLGVYKFFPSGGRGPGAARTLVNNTPANYTDQNWGWCYQILPFIEQDNLFKQPAGQEANIIATPVNIYYCPTRAESRWSMRLP